MITTARLSPLYNWITHLAILTGILALAVTGCGGAPLEDDPTVGVWAEGSTTTVGEASTPTEPAAAAAELEEELKYLEDTDVARQHEGYALVRIIILYAALFVLQAIFVYGFIYLAGRLGEIVQYDAPTKVYHQPATLFVAAFRKGGSLTVLYPIYASTFIWAALLALLFQAVPIRPLNIAGMGLLVIGMFLMGK